AMSDYSESGDVDEVYGVIASNIFYFSDSFDTSATVIFNATGTDADSGVRGIDFGAFGEDPAEDTSSPYTGSYIIDSTDSTGSITVTIYDNVGNSASDTITCLEDSINPTLTDAMSDYSESGDVDEVYGVIASNIFYFSDSFDTSATVIFNATGTDADSGVRGIDFGAFGADDPSEDTSSPYTGSYTIDDVDTSGSITVTIYDNVGNNATESITCLEDSAPPTFNALNNYLDTDDDTGDGYAPSSAYGVYEAFYDEATFVADIDFTESGSGIKSTQLKTNGGSYGTSVVNGIGVSCTLTSESSNDIWYRLEDNVGNVAEADSDYDVYYGTSSPVNMDIDITGTASWTPGSPSYAWISDPTDITSGTLYLGSVGNTNWGIDMDASGTWGSGDAWKVIFEAGWGVLSDIEDTVAPYSTGNVYSSNTGAEADIWVDIVNRCGVRLRITLTTTADTTGPTMDLITVSGNDSSKVADWDQDGLGFIIDFGGTSDTGSGGNGWIIEFNDSTPDVTGGYWTTSDPYIYPDDVGDGSLNPYTFYAIPIDRVGNEGSIVQSDDGFIDETDPVLNSATFISPDYSPNWYDQGSTSSATYRIDFSEDNVYAIYVVCTIDSSDHASDAGEDQVSPFDSNIELLSSFTDGNYSISITIWDKSGRNDTTIASGSTFILLDNTAPLISINFGAQIEGTNGAYLYWDSTNLKWWYGDGMGASNADLTVGVDSSDPQNGGVSSGLSHAISADVFGGTALARTDSTESGGSPTYDVPVVNINSTDTFTGNLTITVYDLVGNSNSTTIPFDRDVTAPSAYSIALVPDTNDGLGYTPNTGYYDDDSVDVDATDSTSVTEIGSGLPGNLYAYQIDSEGWTAWTSSDIYQFTTVSNGLHTLYVKIIDNVGNEGTIQSTTVTVDTTAPTGFTITFGRAGGYPPWYAELNGTTLKFNNEKNDYFNVTINNDGTIGPSNFWKVEWDKFSVFEVAANDSSGLPDSKDFYY
ncbi:MAG: hypothetical protein ACTSPB_18190, partial [Candidatus Thorarchaeota archaeon]